MNKFSEYIKTMNKNINEESDISLKKEIACKNIQRLIGSNIIDKYVKKITCKGQRETSRLVVHLHNGDILELIPSVIQSS